MSDTDRSEMSPNTEARNEISNDILMYRYSLCSNINNFRSEEKYVDVVVQCEDISFRCHRNILASATKFFDAMFSGNFKEGKEGSVISLPKTDAKTFEYVLQFIYTGDVTVSSANALDILEASEFFGLPDMEKLVVQFVEETRMDMKNTLDMFHFACKTQKQELIGHLRNAIASNLDILSREKGFFEISFNDLRDILDEYAQYDKGFDDVLLGAITRWINHNRENRVQYFAELITVITDINSQWMRYMINLLVSGSDSSLSYQTVKPIGFYDNSEMVREVRTPYSMCIYVRYPEENLMRLFSMNKCDKCSFSCEVPLFQPNHWMKCVESNYYLYSMHYVRRESDYSDRSACNQSFCVSTLANMNSKLCLEAPPVIFGDVSLCSIQNQIYVYKKTLSRFMPTANLSNSGIFSNEEIGRGIYLHNRELNLWFPVPEMSKKLQNACMTSIDNRLYLIGGEPVDNDTNYQCYAQAYDHRAGVWNALPKSLNNYVRADCCRRRSISAPFYVCGGVTPALEKYNPTAGKWSTMEPPPIHKQYYQIRYSILSNEFYAMSGVTGDLSIQIFNKTDTSGKWAWTNSSALTEEAKKITCDLSTATIVDSIIFKC